MYWNIELSEHFICDHPLGTVLGKGKYGDYFSVYQNVTVGANVKDGEWIWPTLGDYVTMYSNSSVIGNSHIGSYVIFSINSCVVNEDVPDNCIVFGQSPNLVIKRYNRDEMQQKLVKEWMF